VTRRATAPVRPRLPTETELERAFARLTTEEATKPYRMSAAQLEALRELARRSA
jgi:hypothetical protein